MPDAPGREISAANLIAGSDRVVRPFLLAKLEIEDGSPSETIFVTNMPFDISFSGDTYLGVGSFGAISTVGEGAELTSRGIVLELNGIDISLVAVALSKHIQGDRCTVTMGFLDEGHDVIDDPFVVFRGRMDVMRITMGETASIRLSVEDTLADWNRPRERRYNNATQQERFSGDKFFEFAEQTTDKDVVWPSHRFFSTPQFQ